MPPPPPLLPLMVTIAFLAFHLHTGARQAVCTSTAHPSVSPPTSRPATCNFASPRSRHAPLPPPQVVEPLRELPYSRATVELLHDAEELEAATQAALDAAVQVGGRAADLWSGVSSGLLEVFLLLRCTRVPCPGPGRCTACR